MVEGQVDGPWPGEWWAPGWGPFRPATELCSVLVSDPVSSIWTTDQACSAPFTCSRAPGSRSSVMKVGLRKFWFTLPGAEDQDGDGEGSKTGKSELRADTGQGRGLQHLEGPRSLEGLNEVCPGD